jgi:hypothetical protein
MRALLDSIEFIRRLKRDNPEADKAYLQAAFEGEFRIDRARSVLSADSFAMRFSEARTGSFSNTVLSLSALKAYDQNPFVVVVARQDRVDFLLANSTFLKKISHSSHQLRPDNIKGSFNGTDIMSAYEGLPNVPDHFEALFALHSAFTWEENVERLVEATNAIVGRDNRFQPSDATKAVIMAAPERAAAAIIRPEFQEAERELCELVNDRRAAILQAARIDNVNIRGNAIEQLLTGVANAHELGDLVRPLGDGRLVIDIKTKLLDRASAPKAYNIDKMLTFLAEPGSVFAFFMIGVDLHAGSVSARLLPVLESALLEATCIQHHWAGRTSRGVTQLSGQFGRASAPDYQPVVDLARAHSFLDRLLRL